MIRAISIDRRRTALLVLLALSAALMAVVVTQPAFAASVVEEDRAMGEEPRPVEEGSRQDRVVVAPESPRWSGWGQWNPGQHRSAPRIDVWVDRGEWSTYRPGDRLWVYFRVDRPCYVTILDYSPDGRVSTIYPSRWSGSSFVSPGRTYRVPESRRYSLRIAGTGGVETLVACAHETPWPSGPVGAWIPQRHPNRGRVVVGRSGGSPPSGRRGRVVVGPRNWPVPPQWHDRPELWSCDSVSFRVAGDGWYGGSYDNDWDDDDWDDDWRDDGRDYNGGWSEWGGNRERNDRRQWGDRRGRTIIHDSFRMNDCSDDYSVGFDIGPTDAEIQIDCVESSKGDPTEIVGRVAMEDRWGDDVLFRIDINGDHGVRPEKGRVFVRQWGDTMVEVEVTGYKSAKIKDWQKPRIKWIEFEVRAFRS